MVRVLVSLIMGLLLFRAAVFLPGVEGELGPEGNFELRPRVVRILHLRIHFYGKDFWAVAQ